MSEETHEIRTIQKMLYPEMTHLSKVEYRRHYQNKYYQQKRDEKRLERDFARFGRIMNREPRLEPCPSKQPEYVKEYNKRYYAAHKEKMTQQVAEAKLARKDMKAQGIIL